MINFVMDRAAIKALFNQYTVEYAQAKWLEISIQTRLSDKIFLEQLKYIENHVLNGLLHSFSLTKILEPYKKIYPMMWSVFAYPSISETTFEENNF